MVRQYMQSAAFVLLHVGATCFATTEAATSCKMLSDHNSILATVIKDMTEMTDSDFNELPLKQVFGEIDAQMPWLSQCAAAMDPSAIMTQVMLSTTLSECSRRLEQQPFPESFTGQAMNDVVCPFYKNTIVPCIIDGIVNIGMSAMKNSGGCCDPMVSTLQQWFGNDIPTITDKLLQHVGNIICSTKTTKSSSTPQYCALAIVNAFSQMNMDISVLNFGQIPSSQVCDALAEKSFINTGGAKTTFPITSGNDIGICYQPIDYLLQYVRNYPLMKTGTMLYDSAGTSFAVSDLFVDDKCINGNSLMKWVGLSTNPVMMGLGALDGIQSVLDAYFDSGYDTNLTASALDWLETVQGPAKALCFHLPNNAPCAYSDETIAYPYTAVAAPTTPAPTTPALTPTQTPTATTKLAASAATKMSGCSVLQAFTLLVAVVTGTMELLAWTTVA